MIVSEKSRAIGDFYVCSPPKEKSFTCNSSSTFSIIKLPNDELKGITCLHVLPEDTTNIKFFINFSEEYIKQTIITPEIHSSFIEVQVEYKQFYSRYNIINSMWDECFHIQGLHPRPSMDILLFDPPKNMKIDHYFEIETNVKITKTNDFAFYIGYIDDDSSAISKSDELYSETFDKNTEINTRDLVNVDKKSVWFLQISDPDRGTFIGNVFTGSSGAPIISENGKVIGISGLTFYDTQEGDSEEKDYNTKTEVQNIHYFESKCNEIAKNGSCNFNIYFQLYSHEFKELLKRMYGLSITENS